jgi:hypothetical protein
MAFETVQQNNALRRARIRPVEVHEVAIGCRYPFAGISNIPDPADNLRKHRLQMGVAEKKRRMVGASGY